MPVPVYGHRCRHGGEIVAGRGVAQSPEAVGRIYAEVWAGGGAVSDFNAALAAPTVPPDYAFGVWMRPVPAPQPVQRISRGRVASFVTDRGAGFWQGDGICAEAGWGALAIEDVQAIGCGDAGFDLKSAARVHRIAADRCRVGLKAWSAIEIGTLMVRDPVARGGSAGPFGVQLLSLEATACAADRLPGPRLARSRRAARAGRRLPPRPPRRGL